MSKGSWTYAVVSLVLIAGVTLIWAGLGWDWSRESPRGVPGSNRSLGLTDEQLEMRRLRSG